MVNYCCVVGCKSNENMVDRKFFPFPMLDRRNGMWLSKSQARQQAWLNALKKPNFSEEQYKYSKVCDLHFITGRPANLQFINHLDWVPSKNLGHGEMVLEDEFVDVDSVDDEDEGILSTQTDPRDGKNDVSEIFSIASPEEEVIFTITFL